MGTSITVPEHVQARLQKKPLKQNFLPMNSKPHPNIDQLTHLKIEDISSSPPLREKSPKIVFKQAKPITINQVISINDPKKLTLPSGDCNSKQQSFHLNDIANNISGDGSLVWKNLSSEGKSHFKEISQKRKQTKNYRSITVIQEQDINIAIGSEDHHRKRDEYQKVSLSTNFTSSQRAKPKQRVKLKSLSVQEEYKGSKKRVHLYLQNAENIYQ